MGNISRCENRSRHSSTDALFKCYLLVDCSGLGNANTARNGASLVPAGARAHDSALGNASLRATAIASSKACGSPLAEFIAVA